MKPDETHLLLPTVSFAFLDDWLGSLAAHYPEQKRDAILAQVGLRPYAATEGRARARVTHDQIVRLYQLVVADMGDEMMGLWGRTIRRGALKHLCASVLAASSLAGAMFRFTSFWNLLLDDHHMSLERDGAQLRVVLTAHPNAAPTRFGHVLMLKLAHGIASWLVRRELPLQGVAFAFERPDFAEDYTILFPAPIRFDHRQSALSFDADLGAVPMARQHSDTQEFLRRAPRDWIFTSLREHTLPLRVREVILGSERLEATLAQTAAHLNMTPRTLMRRLEREGASFQGIKDGVRRDIAIRDLRHGGKSIEALSHDLGFASAANFHRAFRRWTDMTPGTYRKGGSHGIPRGGGSGGNNPAKPE